MIQTRTPPTPEERHRAWCVEYLREHEGEEWVNGRWTRQTSLPEYAGNGMECMECGASHSDWEKVAEYSSPPVIVDVVRCNWCGETIEGERL